MRLYALIRILSSRCILVVVSTDAVYCMSALCSLGTILTVLLLHTRLRFARNSCMGHRATLGRPTGVQRGVQPTGQPKIRFDSLRPFRGRIQTCINTWRYFECNEPLCRNARKLPEPGHIAHHRCLEGRFKEATTVTCVDAHSIVEVYLGCRQPFRYSVCVFGGQMLVR